jgi:2,3,4,5-tetrahydropyridine-2-carboxylate N-succinyltransferase
MDYQVIIEYAWENRSALKEPETIAAIEHVIEALDKGQLRVASPKADGSWEIHEWVKKAVILYFPTRQMKTTEAGPMEFHDKMELKRNYAELGVRVVPHAIARYGA